MEYVLIVAAPLLLVYGIWFFKNLLRAGRAKKIYRDYQSLLDQKLKPLGFEKQEALIGGRERIASYKRNVLEVSLSYAISYDTNLISLINGEYGMSIDLSDTNEVKNKFIQALDTWLAENQ